MSFEKKHKRVLEKSNEQTGCHFGILLEEGTNMVSGIEANALKDSDLNYACLLYSKENKQLCFGKIDGNFYKLGLENDGDNTSINLALDFSTIQAPITYIQVANSNYPVQLLLGVTNEVSISEKCIIYWETNQMSQLLIYSYDPLLERMNCTIQTVKSYLPKAFLRQTLWSLLPIQVKNEVLQKQLSAKKEEASW